MRIFTAFIRRLGFVQPVSRACMTMATMAVLTLPAVAADLGLIDTAVLHKDLTKWVILDARPKGDWEGGHIPGALSLPWETFTRTDERGVQYSSFPPGEIAVALAVMGIDEKTPVVVYGDADKSWGGEGYNAWLLAWLGHKGPIRLLHGGIQAWKAQSLPLARGADRTVVKKARYRFDLKPEHLVATEDLQRQKGAYVLVDVRSTLEWFKGKIPGAIHIPWEDFFTGKDRHPLTQAELKKLLAKHGVDTTRPVVFYCLGGIRSGYVWLVYQLAGMTGGRNYRGGWAAWDKLVR